MAEDRVILGVSQPDSGVKVSHVEASHVVAAATECKCCHAHETPSNPGHTA